MIKAQAGIMCCNSLIWIGEVNETHDSRRLTAARYGAEVPAFGRAGGEAPGPGVSIGVSAVIHLEILVCKTRENINKSEELDFKDPARCWFWLLCRGSLTPGGCSRGCEVSESPSVGRWSRLLSWRFSLCSSHRCIACIPLEPDENVTLPAELLGAWSVFFT